MEEKPTKTEHFKKQGNKLKNFLKILLISLLLISSANAGFFKNIGKGAVAYGAYKVATSKKTKKIAKTMYEKYKKESFHFLQPNTAYNRKLTEK